MKERLVKLLACPGCRCSYEIEVTSQKDGEIWAGRLRCPKCQKDFPIRDGIPRFVPSDSYAHTFSFEWRRWRRTQFDTTSRKSSETSFWASTGKWPRELAGKLVLDCGCGPGRYSDPLGRAGVEVVGADLSLAIDVAQENLGKLPNCHFLQADLRQLPFLPGTFDFLFSLGVLMATPNTRDTFLRLVPLLKPGGEVAIWVYPRHRLTDVFRYFPDRVNEVLAYDVNFQLSGNWEKFVRRSAKMLDVTMETSSSIQRVFTTRLPIRWLYWLCHVAIPLYYLYRIPLFYPLRLVTKIAMDPDPEWRVLDTFDWYSPKYQFKHTYPEVQGWFKEAGLEDIKIQPRPVAVSGKKPAR